MVHICNFQIRMKAKNFFFGCLSKKLQLLLIQISLIKQQLNRNILGKHCIKKNHISIVLFVNITF